MKPDFFVCYIVCIICFLFCAIGKGCGKNKEAQKWREDVVARGYATWVVKPDGSTEFKWK